MHFDMANKIILYAGRNADGEIVFFGTKPYKNKTMGYWSVDIGDKGPIFNGNENTKEIFSDLNWWDDEPVKVTIELKK